MTSALMGLLLLLATAGPAAADLVHLKNGRSIEGIVMEASDQQVLIRLAFGEIGLPPSSILSIERSDSPLAEYLERREVLVTRGAAAPDWLSLAHWADGHGLAHSCRESALTAARLDPGLEGLDPLMQRFGYAFDETSAVWLPYDEVMRRRGYVRSGSLWLSPAEATAQRQARAALERQRQEQQRQDRLTRAVEMMALARIAEAEESRRRLEEAPRYPVGLPLYGAYPIVVTRSGYRPGPPGKPRPPHHSPSLPAEVEPYRSGDAHLGRIVSRAPGSWIPVSPGPRILRGVRSVAGSSYPP